MTPKSKEIFDMTPDSSLLEDIGKGAYTTPEALAELAANSFDAEIQGLPMTIQIEVTPEEILFLDNGRGMSKEILKAAMKLAVKMDSIRASTGPRKGMFGLGMKTACASLGLVYNVTTKDLESGEISQVNIDLISWRKNSGKENFRWTQEVISLESGDVPELDSIKSGTLIRITSLKDNSPSIGAIADRLAHVYKPALMSGSSIILNGSPIPVLDFQVVEGTKMSLDHVLELSNGSRIELRGWAGLDSQTHNDGLYGINIYRAEQLISAWNKEWFRAHLMTSRVVGELYFKDLGTNFLKNKLEYGTEEWKVISAYMKEWLKPIVSGSQELNRGRNDALKQQRVVQGLQVAMGVANSLGDDNSDLSSNVNDVENSSSNRGSSGIEWRERTLRFGNEEITLASQFAHLGNDDPLPWDYIFAPDVQELQTVINMDSPLYDSLKDGEFYATLAMADTVVDYLVQSKGYPYEKVKKLRDKWLEQTILAVEKKSFKKEVKA
jgi:Histidine kinase-, DNA gyrase B-, and HSP90-like ATPase